LQQVPNGSGSVGGQTTQVQSANQAQAATNQPPVLRLGQPMMMTVSNGQNGGQQLLSPAATINAKIALPFVPGTQVSLALQPDGQSVRLTPMLPPALAGGAPIAGVGSNPYAAAGQGSALVPNSAKAVDVPVSSLMAAPPQTGGASNSMLSDVRAQALAAQAAMAPMFANLSQMMRPSAPTPLPPDLAALASQILGLRMDGDKGISADKLKTAVARSGLLHEASLGKGLPQQAMSDMKGLLARLGAALGQYVSKEEMAQLAKEGAKPMPPQRGSLFEATPQQMARMGAGGEVLLPQLARDVEAALSRLKLLQLASTSEKAEAQGDTAPREGVRREMQLELPLQFHNRTTMVQMLVEEERQRRGEEGEGGANYRVHFSMQLGGQGAVNAQVNLGGGKFRVFLWAEDAELRNEVRGGLERLRANLQELGLDLAEIECRKFQLPQKGKTLPGQLMNEVS